MASIYVDGIRMDWIRPCAECGRKPVVHTSYKDMPPGWGPFIITCDHGHTEEEKDRWVESGDWQSPPFNAYRSWYKTRAVRGWNAMQVRIIERKKHEETKAMVWAL